MEVVSVPIRGSFNLTNTLKIIFIIITLKVSVPIRGLFNLTMTDTERKVAELNAFPSPLGDYLI